MTNRANAYCQLKKYVSAHSLSYVCHNPTHHTHTHSLSQRYDEAIKDCDKAIELYLYLLGTRGIGLIKAYTRRATAKRCKGDILGAIGDIEEAIKVKPHMEELHRRLEEYTSDLRSEESAKDINAKSIESLLQQVTSAIDIKDVEKRSVQLLILSTQVQAALVASGGNSKAQASDNRVRFRKANGVQIVTNLVMKKQDDYAVTSIGFAILAAACESDDQNQAALATDGSDILGHAASIITSSADHPGPLVAAAYELVHAGAQHRTVRVWLDTRSFIDSLLVQLWADSRPALQIAGARLARLWACDGSRKALYDVSKMRSLLGLLQWTVPAVKGRVLELLYTISADSQLAPAVIKAVDKDTLVPPLAASASGSGSASGDAAGSSHTEDDKNQEGKVASSDIKSTSSVTLLLGLLQPEAELTAYVDEVLALFLTCCSQRGKIKNSVRERLAGAGLVKQCDAILTTALKAKNSVLVARVCGILSHCVATDDGLHDYTSAATLPATVVQVALEAGADRQVEMEFATRIIAASLQATVTQDAISEPRVIKWLASLLSRGRHVVKVESEAISDALLGNACLIVSQVPADKLAPFVLELKIIDKLLDIVRERSITDVVTKNASIAAARIASYNDEFKDRLRELHGIELLSRLRK
eukprot:TRINITY_DN2485_c0_g1_i6.p1 TRINITY_DN2485_c0_g1~~TRINITY_DN2485_c0_g1_i6.p1  ORF type:complete len:647 (-),score=103.52 TRINITY_DN2485_c0_g1_i6:354-2294(-)